MELSLNQTGGCSGKKSEIAVLSDPGGVPTTTAMTITSARQEFEQAQPVEGQLPHVGDANFVSGQSVGEIAAATRKPCSDTGSGSVTPPSKRDHTELQDQAGSLPDPSAPSSPFEEQDGKRLRQFSGEPKEESDFDASGFVAEGLGASSAEGLGVACAEGLGFGAEELVLTSAAGQVSGPRRYT